MEKFKVYLAEFLGTMLLIAMGTGTLLFSAQSGLMGVSLAFGFAIIIGAYAFGAISGAHLNPAVSLAMAMNKRIAWLDFLGYVGAQLLGAITGSTMILGVWLSTGMIKKEMFSAVPLGSTVYGGQNMLPVSMVAATIIEMVLTFVLVLVILMVTSEKFGAGAVTGLVIALTLTGLILVGGNLTGGSLNPARSFGPALVEAIIGNTKAIGEMGVYLVGPLVGGALAAVVAKFFGSEQAA